jgi:2-phospho-L-lactate guanylyltransferase
MRMNATWAIVPVKQFSVAKLRLAEEMSPADREALSLAMLTDRLHALSRVPEIDEVCVVSNESSLASLCHRYDFRRLSDPPGAGSGLNEAVQHAVLFAKGHGADSCCVLHADLPLASAQCISRLLKHHAARPGASCVTLVPDRRAAGTNVLVSTPCLGLPFCFGRNSLALHKAAAAKRNIAVDTFTDPDLALDIDSPEDFAALSGLWVQQAHALGVRTRSFVNTFHAGKHHPDSPAAPRRTA